MDDRYALIQQSFLSEMGDVMPDVLAWWDARAGGDPDRPNGFERRWPAGPVAHPRVLDVVRRHWLRVDDLNLENERPPPPRPDSADEANWGASPPPGTRAYIHPADLLIQDLERIEPDLFEIMAGLVFVPVGADPDGEAS